MAYDGRPSMMNRSPIIDTEVCRCISSYSPTTYPPHGFYLVDPLIHHQPTVMYFISSNSHASKHHQEYLTFLENSMWKA